MSLLTSTVYRELEGALGPLRPETSYTLSRTGAGWTLLMHGGSMHDGPGSRSGWSTPLAPHGAGPAAPPRVAQAVGVRVLHEIGVEVLGWKQVPGAPDEPTADFVAETVAGTRRTLNGPRAH